MGFNKEHFWWDGNKWILLRNISYEDLKTLQYNIGKEGYTSKKIDNEIEERHIYRNMCDLKVLETNKCTKTEKNTETKIEIKEYNFD